MPSPWHWNETSHRYHNTETGRFLSANQMAPLRDAFVESQRQGITDITDKLYGREITIQEWVLQFRSELKITYLDQYMIARGGRKVMTQSDYGRVGGFLREQFQYLNALAESVAKGEISEAQLRTRSQMYINSSVKAFEAGKVASYSGLKLPAVPGQDSECLSNCKCRWQISETAKEWRCTWIRTAAESCPTCRQRAAEWAPLVISKAA